MTPAIAPLLALVLAAATDGPAEAPGPDASAATTAAASDAGPDAGAASTAAAAAAGGADAGLATLPLPPVDPATFDGLVGPRRRAVAVRDGFVVETWTDATGREAPLVVRYRRVDGAVAVDSIDRSPRHPTSFDCGRATRDLERVVCAVEALAALDLALARAYQSAVAKASPARRVVVRDAQARWLAEREARCAAPDRWVECLEASYRERLAELGEAVP